MAKSRMIIKSNFRLLPGAARDGIEDAVDAWQEEGEDQSKSLLSKKEAQRGYALNTLYDSIDGEKLGQLNAKFGTSVFYARFFEYGTVYIEPLPFLRPAKTKADRKFKSVAGHSVARAFARKAV